MMHNKTAEKLKKNPFYKPNYLQESAIDRLKFSQKKKEEKINYHIIETPEENIVEVETNPLPIHETTFETNQPVIKRKRRKKKVEEENGQTE